MKEWFNSEEEANEYKETHQLFGRGPEQLTGSGKWALNFPLEAHVTILQPHAYEWGFFVPAKQ
jgi:hypothetical protein